jgi:NADH-quinone oxidoreductase subunit E
MLAIASQIILCLVLAALLGLIIGYLLGKSNCPKDDYKAGVVHDAHTHDDGDCDDQAEAEEVEASESEAQGLLQETEEASVEEAEEDETSEAAVEDLSAELDAQKTEEPSASERTENAGNQVSEAETEAPSDDDKPTTLLDAPRDGQKDNLTRIKGIGVKIDSLLNNVGVYHFDQIAAWTEKEAAWIDHQVSFPGRSMRDDWIGQAKLLAEGKETEFSKRVDKGEVSSSKKA